MKPQPNDPEHAPESHTDMHTFDLVLNLMFDYLDFEADECAKCETDYKRLDLLNRIELQVGREIIISWHGIGKKRDKAHHDAINNLILLASFTYAWLCHRLEDQVAGPLEIIEMIWRERQRKRCLMREGNVTFARESPIAGETRNFFILNEEIRKVAKAIDTIEVSSGAARAEADHELTNDLAQVTAVAIAWLESDLTKTLNEKAAQ